MTDDYRLIALIKKHIQEKIEAHKKILEVNEKEHFYELGLDSDDAPNSFGNADDVYSDGFDNGLLEGHMEAYGEIQKLIETYFNKKD